jgi:hypothetical protein
LRPNKMSASDGFFNILEENEESFVDFENEVVS